MDNKGIMQTTLVYQTEDLDSSKSKLINEHPELSEVSINPPILWKLVSEVPVGNVAAYSSGKIVIQSLNNDWAKGILTSLNNGSQDDFVPHIGVDEAGKGDFFGPLVTCALYVPNSEVASQLQMEGVRDSKTISDSTILKLYEKIVQTCPDYSVVTIGPKRLTELLGKSRNINKTLAWAHSQAIENVLEKVGDECHKVVIDQFSKKKSRVLDALMENGKKLEIVQKHGGESDVAVAAASIVARAVFVMEMDKLSEKYSVKFPKGASDVIEFASDFKSKYGMEKLEEVAKTSFKISSRI
ncbi:MAG: ribonuclease HIII [bacterium]